MKTTSMVAPLALPGMSWVLPTTLVAAAVALAGAFIVPVDGWSGMLVGAVHGLTIALGGTLFVALHLVVGARWWDPIRHVPATLGKTLWLPGAVLAFTVILGMTTLYPWARPDVVAASHLLQGKTAWLNVPFFLARTAVVLSLWVLFAGVLARISLHGGKGPGGLGAVGVGAMFLVIFALTISVGFWDWTMSLEPTWFSTMWGVYGFSGTLQGGIAAVALLSVMRAGRPGGLPEVKPKQLHDLGKLLFAFSFFWAYIWFCQFMLIWYADLPEETSHYMGRLTHGWTVLFWLNPILSFVIPFVLLLPVWTKKSPKFLGQVALVVLLARWFDVYMMIAPPVQKTPRFPFFAIASSVAVLGGMWFLYQRATNGTVAGVRSGSAGDSTERIATR